VARDRDKPAECPACGADRVARVVYGLPLFTTELERDLEEGRVVLGGCAVFDDSPQWECLGCRHKWGDLAFPPAEDPI